MNAYPNTSLERLIAEDAVGQLRRQDGLMATLGSENGALKLDWVEGIARLLNDPTKLEGVEAEARLLWEQGIRHIIWSGMGGSVITVHVLAELGFCDGENGTHIAIYPLDSTDPATINTILRKIAAAKQGEIPAQDESNKPEWLQVFLQDVMMIGVSMGMTSEEPITHLEWFTELLTKAQLPLAQHLLVMTLPGSYLDQFAQQHGVPSRPLQLDGGNGTGGRMSAPTTRVFLLPAAIYLSRTYPHPGSLRSMLHKAWNDYDLHLAKQQPAQHPFVQVAAVLNEQSDNGVCRLLLKLPDRWKPLLQWLEQLMEESLGKGQKGIVVFPDQPLDAKGWCYHTQGLQRVEVSMDQGPLPAPDQQTFVLAQPYLDQPEPSERLAALATSFLGWQLCMALYGYLQHITFAGQPAVENYKARARVLRNQANPLDALPGDQGLAFQRQKLFAPAPSTLSAENTFTHALSENKALQYLDLTINGNLPPHWEKSAVTYVRDIGNTELGIPVKMRRAPAAYHSTEQSEMDGTMQTVSLRLVTTHHEPILLGTYTDTFLRAQAVSTWQAMIEQGRACFLFVVDGSQEQAMTALEQFSQAVYTWLLKDIRKDK